MRVVITGVSGLIGSTLAQRLIESGHAVSGTTSRRIAQRDLVPGLQSVCALDLERPGAADLFAGCDLVVHAAYRPGARFAEQNFAGTRAIALAAHGSGVRRQIFISSVSAGSESPSAYGRLKAALEDELRPLGADIVRPGLVIGPGGLFRRMVGTVERLPIVPLPDGGIREVQWIGIEDLTAALEHVISKGASHPLVLTSADRPTLRTLLILIARGLEVKRLFLPIPVSAALTVADVLNRLGLPSFVDVDNLRGYRLNAERVLPSDLSALVKQPTALSDQVARVCQSLHRKP